MTYLHMHTIVYVLLNFMHDKYTMVNTWINKKKTELNLRLSSEHIFSVTVCRQVAFALVVFQINARISRQALKPTHLPNKWLLEFFPGGKRSGCHVDY